MIDQTMEGVAPRRNNAGAMKGGKRWQTAACPAFHGFCKVGGSVSLRIVMKPTILRVAVPVPLYRLFDYLAPDGIDAGSLEPGLRFSVPFGRHNKIAYLVEVVQNSAIAESRLKKAHAQLDEKPLLTPRDLELLHWASRYYHHPLGEVIDTAFPVLLRQGREAENAAEKHLCLTDCGMVAASVEFARAPRQAALVELLKSNRQGLAVGTLADLGWNWRDSARRLMEKGYVKWVETAGGKGRQATAWIPPCFSPNPAQRRAIDDVAAALGSFQAFLLEGVTGSGKTEVYMQVVSSVLARGEQAMVLLPEIALTPQLEARFRARFSVPIAVFHSGLGEAERRNAWLGACRGEAPILLGTRSAVFTPLARPGLIILDEEHDTSFKQQEGFRFSARDIAIVKARKLDIPVLLGTATPSMETLHNVDKGRYRHLHLPERAGCAKPPPLRLLDIRNRKLVEGLSPPLIEEIRQTLARGEQVLLFLNRRGYAPTLICHGCGWVARCRRCDANLVVHFGARRLHCHHCGYDAPIVSNCGQCGGAELHALGLGTERVEGALKQLFPEAVSARIDRDTTRLKGSLQQLLGDIASGRVNILLGTQMLAKGHHFPDVTLVGILDADAGLFSTDFHATERMAQMIIQVAGRAGRAEKPGTVVLQTRQPEHPLLLSLAREGYRHFARRLLSERRAARLPPYSYQALIRALAAEEGAPMHFLERLRQIALECAAGRVEVLGPVPAPMTKRAGQYRYQLLLQSTRREPLHGVLDALCSAYGEIKEAKRVRWSVDVDPVDLY